MRGRRAKASGVVATLERHPAPADAGPARHGPPMTHRGKTYWRPGGIEGGLRWRGAHDTRRRASAPLEMRGARGGASGGAVGGGGAQAGPGAPPATAGRGDGTNEREGGRLPTIHPSIHPSIRPSVRPSVRPSAGASPPAWAAAGRARAPASVGRLGSPCEARRRRGPWPGRAGSGR
eukprot:scaffold2128_cov371-Prasinococcus_capsulatus_cf.AAC.6